MPGRGQPQIRLDDDVTDALDDERGEDSRAQFANWILRNALRTTPDMRQPVAASSRRFPQRRVRPTPYNR